MVLNFALAGRSRIEDALHGLRDNPGYAVGMVSGTILAVGLTAVWGIHAWTGWHRMRTRLQADGFTAFGEVLAPSSALHDFRDGIWRGLWRVWGSTLAFILLQIPIICIVMVPFVVATWLFTPVAGAYGAHPTMNRFVEGIPLFFLVAGAVVIIAQHLIAFKVLDNMTPAFKLGTSFAVTGESWKRTLDHTQTVVSLAVLAGFLGGIGGVFGLLNHWIADGADLSRPDTIMNWIFLAVVVAFGGLFLEAIGRLAEEEDAAVDVGEDPYSFTAWLVAWLTLVYTWLTNNGLMIIATGAVFILALRSAVDAYDGAMWADGSWGGLGWFVAAALILLHLRKSGGES